MRSAEVGGVRAFQASPTARVCDRYELALAAPTKRSRMLDSLYFFLFHVALIYVVVWAIRNDGARRIDDQSGLLKMPGAKTRGQQRETARTSPRGRRWRR